MPQPANQCGWARNARGPPGLERAGPRARKAGGDTFSTVMPWRRVMRRARFKNRRGCLGPGACDPSGIPGGGQFPGQAGSLRLYTRPEPSIGPQRASLRAHRHGSTHHEHDRKRIAARSFCWLLRRFRIPTPGRTLTLAARDRPVPSTWCCVPPPSPPSAAKHRRPCWRRSAAPACGWACPHARGTFRQHAP